MAEATVQTSTTPLPRWDLYELFPEAKSAHDIFALKTLTNDFLSQREKAASVLKDNISEATKNRDLPRLAELLHHQYTAINSDIKRCQNYVTLLHNSHTHDHGLNSLSEDVVGHAAHIRGILRKATYPVHTLGEVEKKQLAGMLPNLPHVKTSLHLDNQPFYKGRTTEEVDALLEQENTLQQHMKATYEEAFAGGIPTSADTYRSGLVVEALNTRLALGNLRAHNRHQPSALAMSCKDDKVPQDLLQNIFAQQPHIYQQINHIAPSNNGKRITPRKSLFHLLKVYDKPAVKYSYDEAKALILTAFATFHPDLVSAAQKAFSEGWIDAARDPQKRPGAYSMSNTVPGAPTANHNHISLHFDGSFESVLTLAHELGHATADHLGFASDPAAAHPSVAMHENFAALTETLVCNHILATEQDPIRQQIIRHAQASKTKSRLSTALANSEFERQLFDASQLPDGKSRRLSLDEIAHLNAGVRRQAMGNNAPSMQEMTDNLLSRHQQQLFYNNPFYNITYCTSYLVAEHILAAFEKEKALGGITPTAQRWMEVIRHPSDMDFTNAMQHMNVPVTSPAFVQQGMAKGLAAINAAEQGIKDVSVFTLLRQFTWTELGHITTATISNTVHKCIERFQKKKDHPMPPSAQPIASPLTNTAQPEKPAGYWQTRTVTSKTEPSAGRAA